MNVEIAHILPDCIIEFQEELPLNHEPSLDHWAFLMAEDDIATGYHSSMSHAYECAWNSLDAEYNYSYI